MTNIRASPKQKERKRAPPSSEKAKRRTCIQEVELSDNKRIVFIKTNEVSTHNRQIIERVSQPRWWTILGSISIISIMTGVIFDQILIIPIISISSALTYLVIQIGNNLRLKKKIDFSASFQNKHFSIKIFVNGK